MEDRLTRRDCGRMRIVWWLSAGWSQTDNTDTRRLQQSGRRRQQIHGCEHLKKGPMDDGWFGARLKPNVKRKVLPRWRSFFLQVLLHSADTPLAVRRLARSALQVTPRWRRVSNATASIVSAIRRITFTGGNATELPPTLLVV